MPGVQKNMSKIRIPDQIFYVTGCSAAIIVPCFNPEPDLRLIRDVAHWSYISLINHL